MKSKLEYIEEYKLIIVKWNGLWDIKEYRQNVDSFINRIDSLDVQSIIHDITDLDIEMNYDYIAQIVKIREDKIKPAFKVVYITSKPIHVIFSELYSNALPNKYSHMYCSTHRKALDLLSLNMSEKELKDRFLLLEKEQKN